MARPWRIQYTNAVYHIMSRGVAQGEIFYADEDYRKFLEYLEKTSEKFQLEIFAFVLMGNHYHLFLRTKEANLSRAMQWLQTSYSVYFNRKYRRSGHLFQGRYKSILVGEESYWRGLSFYIHLNPVRAGMVKELEEYAWSSYHDYVKAKKIHHLVSCEKILKGFGKDEKSSRVEYRKLIREKSGQEKKFLDEIKYGLILGSEEFVGWVQKKFISRLSARDAELPQKTLVGDSGIVEKVLDEVARYFEVERDQLLQRK
ncbi:MAG: transposase, partial [Candidatus Brocadia sp.]|nr:transposase [Candidatus Brocadia sp.]